MEVVCTPRRGKRPLVIDRKMITERRKSLFGVSGVSPLSSPDHKTDSSPARGEPSPSWASEDSSSPKKLLRSSPCISRTPSKTQTPVKLLQNDFTQMALDRTPLRKADVIAPCTPTSAGKQGRVIGAISARRSPRVLGVRKLSPDRGLITPKTFYGKKTMQLLGSGPHTDGKALYQRIRESVRVRLPMETIPREKKRARSGGSGSNPAKRQKKIPRYRLFEEDEQSSTKKTAKRRALQEIRKTISSRTEKDLEDEISALSEPTSAKKVLKSRKSTGDKQTYNWHFFNSKTPPVSKMSKLFAGKSPSVLTPPPTTRKRKLISSFDHLPDGEEEENDENSSIIGNRQHQVIVSSEDALPDYARDICRDFSEDEEEEDIQTKEKNVEHILDELNKDIAEVLGDEVVQDVKNTSNETENSKLYPVFTSRGSIKSPSLRTGIAPTAMKRRKVDAKQLILDVGQSKLREVECSQCGLLYVQGDDLDEEFHDEHHKKSTMLNFPSWKKARFVRQSISGDSIVLVKSGDSNAWWERVRSVLEIVDEEIGYPPEDSSRSQVYLYIKGKQVVGCLTARLLRMARRVLPSLGLDTELCSEEEFPVRAGVSRLWVSGKHRRQGVATELVNALRRNFTYGEILKIEDIAFSSPTEDGKKFAQKYFGRADYFIYTFAPSY